MPDGWESDLSDRRGYQREVTRLLERIEAQTRTQRRLEAAGAQAAALAALERETERTRRKLARVIGARLAMSLAAEGGLFGMDSATEGAAA